MMSRTLHRGLAWLGVAAVVAGSLGASLLSAPLPASAQQLSNVPQTACRAAASGQVATSSRGRDAQWGRSALDRLCNGAETTAGPGECFTFTMTSNSVPWAPGQTHWNSDNAVRLCAGAVDSGRRVNCFVARTSSGTDWSQAIDQCIAEERTMQLQVSPTVTAPRITTPAPGVAVVSPLEQTQAFRRDAAARPARMTCRGPMRVTVMSSDVDNARAPVEISVLFRRVESEAQLAPGRCWREGGWGGTALMDVTGDGIIFHRTELGPCAFLRSMTWANGALTEVLVIDNIAMEMIGMGTSGNRHTFEASYFGDPNTGGTNRFEVARRDFGVQPSDCV
jgi:hypothetical protein